MTTQTHHSNDPESKKVLLVQPHDDPNQQNANVQLSDLLTLDSADFSDTLLSLNLILLYGSSGGEALRSALGEYELTGNTIY